MEIKKVMVIGAGQMGGGIAQVCAQAGFDVKLNDIKEESYDKGLAVITKNLSRNVEKGRMTEDEKTQCSAALRNHWIFKMHQTLISLSKQPLKTWKSNGRFSQNLMKSHLHMQFLHRIHLHFQLRKSQRRQIVLKK